MSNEVLHLTVIVNTFNGEFVAGMIPRALDSVLAQSIDVPWEVIVVNDGRPTKDIRDAIEPYAKRFEARSVQFTFFGTEDESGYQCKPKNVALLHAKGEYIAFLDYDNEWTPQHLDGLYAAMIAGNVWPDFAYSRIKYVLDEGCDEEVTLPGGKKKHKLVTGDAPLQEWNQEGQNRLGQPLSNFIDTSSVMLSKGAFWRLSMATGFMWNEEYRRFGDWELMARGVFFAGWRGQAVDNLSLVYHWTGKNLQLTRPVNESPERRTVDEVEDG